MKKIYYILLLTISTICLRATSYTVSIVGYSYSPATLTVSIGDIVTIAASSAHPLDEVSQATWNANGTATLSSGFGIKTSNYTFTVTSTNTIYYVCTANVSIGMKGQIIVSTSGINEQSTPLGNISIFPNPAKDKFYIKFNSTENTFVTVKIYSICGQEVQSFISNKEFNAGDNSFTVNFQNAIAPGLYFVDFKYNSKKIIKKLIID